MTGLLCLPVSCQPAGPASDLEHAFVVVHNVDVIELRKDLCLT